MHSLCRDDFGAAAKFSEKRRRRFGDEVLYVYRREQYGGAKKGAGSVRREGDLGNDEANPAKDDKQKAAL